MSRFRRGLIHEKIRERLERDTSSDDVTDLLGDEEENVIEADYENTSVMRRWHITIH